MIKFEVKDVACDSGVFEDGELKLICNSRLNALLIKDIMETDQSRSNKTTVYNRECYEKFVNN